MLIEKLKNLPQEKSLKEAQAENAGLSSLVESFLSGVTAASVEALKACETTAAADLLQKIDAGEFPKELKKTARKVMHYLSTRGIKPKDTVVLKKETAAPALVFKEAYASEVDPEGNQLLLGVYADNFGSLTSLYALAGDAIGLKSLTINKVSRKQLQEYINHYEEHHIHMTVLELEEFRWLLYRYYSANEKLQQQLPPAFAQAQKLLNWTEDISPVCPLYAKIYQETEATEYLAKAEKVLSAAKMASWVPADKLKVWQEKYQEAEKGVLVVDEMIKKQQLVGVEAQAQEDLFTEEFGGIIRGRLEVWACLLQAQGKKEQTLAALAAARSLEKEPSSKNNPVIGAMVRAALQGEEALCEHEHEHEHEPAPKEDTRESSILWTPGKGK